MTHEPFVQVLDVGRTFVTRVISRSRQEGAIAPRRGVFVGCSHPDK